jgi:archaellum component FlaC
MAQEQLVSRAIFDSNNKEIRRGLVPKDIPNTKAALVAYWEEEDRIKAAKEAEDAKAEEERLLAEQTPSGDDLVAELRSEVQELKAEVVSLTEKVSVIDDLEIASPESIAACAMAAAMAAGSAEATIQAGIKAREDLKSSVETADAKIEELDGTVKQVVETVGNLVTDCRQMVERNTASMITKVTDAISKRITGLEVQASQMRGPKGNTGNPGVSTLIGSGKPNGPSALEALIGRGAVIGDCYIDGSDDNRRAYRWNGDIWEPGPSMATVQIRDVKVSALDASTKVYPTQSSTVPTGSGSGGGEKLISKTATSGGSVRIGDTSNWTTSPTSTQDPVSGTLFVEVVATNGTYVGHRGYATIAFTYSDGKDEATEYAMVGDLAGIFRCDLTIGRTVAVSPTGVTVVIPSGALRTTVDLTIVAEGADGGTNNFLINGTILWAMSSKGTATLPGTVSEQPSWIWS